MYVDRRLALWSISAVMLGTVSVSHAQRNDAFQAMRVVKPPTVAPAPDFAFRALTGEEMRISSARGKAILLGFFSTT